MKIISVFIALTKLHMAWHTTGHFLTALIAEIELKRDSPELYNKLEDIISVLSSFTAEKSHRFVESAEFADDIKAQNWKAFNSWHYFDHYYFNGVTPKTMPEDKTNIIWAINEAVMNINTNRPTKIDQLLGKSFSLRYLIHLMGDIHQPLHNSSMVSEQFPNGDAGGNSFEINVPSAHDLHSYWDMCLKQIKEIRAPLEEDDFNYLMEMAKQIMEEFPRPNLNAQLEESDLEKWSLEGLDIAEKVVYNSLKPGDTPSDEYVDRGFKVVKQQLALGGYRLADILKKLKIQDTTIHLSQE